MKTTFTKKLAVLCLSAVMVFGLGFGIANLNNANAASAKIELTDIEEKYAFNSNLKLDDRLYGITFDGVDNYVIQEGTITYPNGFIYKANNVAGHKLDQVGQYTVAYKLVTNLGKTITVYDTFDVMSEYFYFSTDNGSTVRASNASNPLGSKLDGISTVLNDGCELVFNKPIDLNKEGLVDIITFDPEGYDKEVLAAGGWSSNADYVTVTLTDAYDASIFVYYRVCVRTQSGYGYVRCGSNTQQDGGLCPQPTADARWDRVACYIDGVRYLNYFAETLGTQSGGGAKNNTLYNLRYDFKNNYAYVDCGSGNRIIAQLQNPECYNAGVKMFPGFTTGEVIVSIKAENYTTPGYQIDITKVGDMSGTELIANYNGTNWEENYKDERAPSIYYDLKKTTQNAVYVAMGEDFVIPTSTVYDVNLATDVNVNVYKDYNDPQQRTPVIINGGKFKVADFEKYTVEYSAKDLAGNVGYATFDVIPVDISSVSSSKPLNNIGTIFFETDKLSKIYSGNTAVLPEFTASTYNLAEELSVKIVATCNGKTYEIDPVTREFIPETTGTYQITYLIKDNATTKTLSYTVECESNGIVRFVSKPFALRDYLAGFTYEIDPVFAYKYVDGAEKVATDVYVQYDEAGEWVKIENLRKFVVSSTASKLQFKYVAKECAPGSDYPVAYTDVASIKNVGYGDKLVAGAYFYGDFTATNSGTNLAYDVVEKEGSHVLSFVNPIALGNFTVEFVTQIKNASSTGTLERVNLIFTDIYDTSKKAVLSVYEQNGSLYFVSDQSSTATLVGGTMLGQATKTFNYDHLLRKAKFGSTQIDYSIDFTSELAYMDIELVNAEGSVRVIPKKVANVTFNTSLKADKKESSWFIQRDHGNKEINTTVTIYSPSVADVLTPSLYYDGYVFISVMDADGNYAYGVDEDGNRVQLNGTENDPRKDYQLTLNQYTTYTVTLKVTDVSAQNTGASTKTRTETYRIYVVNDQAPVITLGNGLSSETVMNVELGKAFEIPYTVEDETPIEDLVISVIIYSKKGGYCVYSSKPFSVILEEGGAVEHITDTCALNRKGEYYVYIYSYDTAGNYSTAYFTVNVV